MGSIKRSSFSKKFMNLYDLLTFSNVGKAADAAQTQGPSPTPVSVTPVVEPATPLKKYSDYDPSSLEWTLLPISQRSKLIDDHIQALKTAQAIQAAAVVPTPAPVTKYIPMTPAPQSLPVNPS